MTGFSALPVEAGPDRYDRKLEHWAGISRILGPRWIHLPAITVGLLGVQIFWSVEMSYASPYLLSLGLSKSLMAIVFIAGPLSGLIVQPLIGVLADNSLSRFGRRRPFMIAGSVLCVFAMLLLGFTRPIASIFARLGSHANDVFTIWLAVFSIYAIDFAINGVMATDRALIVDTLPTSEQASANAWGARMLGVGSVAGFFIGNIDLPHIFPFSGKSQLELFSMIASFVLLFSHFVTAVSVKEKVLLSPSSGKSFWTEFKAIFENILILPRVIRQICIIQFFAWLAWFPVLFYTTLYIGELHKRNSSPPESDAAALALDAKATRLGSRALFYSALLSLAANIVLPFFVCEARQTPITSISPMARKRTWLEYAQVRLASLWAFSHALFAVCMLGTLFTTTLNEGTFLITLTGFSWAITQWAPFSLLAEAILSEPFTSGEGAGSIRLADTRTFRSIGHYAGADDEGRQFLLQDEENGEEFENGYRFPVEPDEEPRPHPSVGNRGAQPRRLDGEGLSGHGHNTAYGDDGEGRTNDVAEGLASKAGIILGIHNVFIVLPQFLITAISAIVFAIFQPEKSGPGNFNLAEGTSSGVPTSANTFRRQDPVYGGPNSVRIIFGIGGVSATVAFVLCWRLARELRLG